ncbi:hypothetical protein LUZ60_012294 [Juncus effusus]|nr:hypothetical protein LUZ60_012294 [Juncus effusus]
MIRRRLRRILLLSRRALSTTTYTARVVHSDKSGRSISVAIDSPSSLPISGHLPRQPRHHLICHVTNLLRSSSPDPYISVSDFVSSLDSPLTTLEASLILKSVKYPSEGLRFFDFLSDLGNFKHDCCTYNRILHIVSRTGDVQLVCSLLDRMEKEGIKGNVATINILIGVLGINGVEKCVKLVKKWGVKINEYTYKCLVQAYIRARDVERGFRVYEEMRKKGFKLDIFAYNMLLHALVQADMADNARKVFDEMKMNNCKPDLYTYTILIRMSGRIEKGINPDVFTYSILIECFGKSNKVEMARELFDEMFRERIKPNIVTYNILMDCLEKKGEINEAFRVFERLKEQGLSPDLITYSIVEKLESKKIRVFRERKPGRETGWIVSLLS